MKYFDVLGLSDDAGAIAYLKALEMKRLKLCLGSPEQQDWQGISLVVTGASLGDSREKDVWKIAKQRGVPTVCLVDHWTHLGARFRSPRHGTTVYPDSIIVNDEVAKGLLMRKGVPENMIHPLGNPVLEEQEWDPVDVPVQRHLQEKKVLLFVSEEVPTADSRLGIGNLGYSEYSVLQSIVDTVSDVVDIEIRLHPADAGDKYRDFGSRVAIARRESTKDIVSKYDYIIGMDSMFLLELASKRSGIISFRPKAMDRLSARHLNALVEVKSSGELRQELQQSTSTSLDFTARFQGSSARIREYLESLLP